MASWNYSCWLHDGRRLFSSGCLVCYFDFLHSGKAASIFAESLHGILICHLQTAFSGFAWDATAAFEADRRVEGPFGDSNRDFRTFHSSIGLAFRPCSFIFDFSLLATNSIFSINAKKSFTRDSTIESLLCLQVIISACCCYSSNLDAVAGWLPWCSLKVGHCGASCRGRLRDCIAVLYYIFTSPENSLFGVRLHILNFCYFFLILTSAADFGHAARIGIRADCCAAQLPYPSTPSAAPASHWYVYCVQA